MRHLFLPVFLLFVMACANTEPKNDDPSFQTPAPEPETGTTSGHDTIYHRVRIALPPITPGESIIRSFYVPGVDESYSVTMVGWNKSTAKDPGLYNMRAGKDKIILEISNSPMNSSLLPAETDEYTFVAVAAKSLPEKVKVRPAVRRKNVDTKKFVWVEPGTTVTFSATDTSWSIIGEKNDLVRVMALTYPEDVVNLRSELGYDGIWRLVNDGDVYLSKTVVEDMVKCHADVRWFSKISYQMHKFIQMAERGQEGNINPINPRE